MSDVPFEPRFLPLLVAVMLASLTVSIVAMASGFSFTLDMLMLVIIIMPFWGTFFALPGIALAYMILRMYRKLPHATICIGFSTCISALVFLLWQPFWGSISDFPVAFFAAGPLSGLIFYCVEKKK